ncbi:cytochrome c [Methylobacillus gramineus]|uniref:c-type cytochrome n=1 Tax=Methylobacillus gramineus TaxID=755169 RepID=UPI001D000AD1|nr:cytochrome c [Methylobacillus gramineus]MCB5185615.1 cytochrome c [Methylobacillus gramineus]
MGLRKFAVLVVGAMVMVMGATSYAEDEADAAEAVNKAPASAQICGSCHGADGNSMVPMFPKIAGQHPEYLEKQLKNIKSNVRISPVMMGIVATLADEDVTILSKYFSQQTPKPGNSASNGAGSVGEKIYLGGIPGAGVPACASCHGINGNGLAAGFPRLAGQHAAYTVTQVKAFRDGQRKNDAAKMMRMVSAKMTDDDIAAVADYIQGLK